jgi:hypothetical protein
VVGVHELNFHLVGEEAVDVHVQVEIFSNLLGQRFLASRKQQNEDRSTE